jgi:ABC-type uncharacterized transport system substrate-binding protein
MQIIARALSFMSRPLSGDVSVGIAYAPGNSQSAHEAATVQKILSGGLRVGNLSLKPVPLPAGDLGGAKVDVLFLTAGLNSEAQAIVAASRARHIPCVTTDLAQVKSGICTMGVRSQPRVEILVNRAAAAADGTAFSTVFRMMITEI